MKVLVRRSHSQKGTTVFVDRVLDVATLRIGRGTEQDLEIADPRVALAHAEVLPQTDGSHVVQARTRSGVWVNGAPCAIRRIEFPDILNFGRFQVSLLKPAAGTDLALLIEEREASSREDRATVEPITRLQDTRLSRRGLAWGAALLVLATMLLIPLLLRYGQATADATPPSSMPLVPTDAVWNSGPVSSAHAYFETACATCHAQPFEPVRNAACLSCHDGTRHHVLDPTHAALPAFASAQCTDCHREHNGPEGTIVRRASLCTDCHAEPSERFADTKLTPMRSFSKQHPPFSPLLTRFDPTTRSFHAASVSQTPGVVLSEDTGLRFPHDLHLASKGVDAPEGSRVLDCAACHVADLGQISFEPVSMEKHCADCHRLEFDPEAPTRVVPHGKPAEVAAVLRDYFASRALSGGVKALGALPVTPERRRPGPARTRAERQALASWSEQQGDVAVREVFEGRLCSYCHVVEQTGDAKLPWIIAPVALQEHTLRGAAFTHKPHSVAPCGDCHEAQTSRLSSDVLLPTLEHCRACHGDDDSRSQVSNTCIDCHSYHLDASPLWDPQATQRKQHDHNQRKAGVTLRGAP